MTLDQQILSILAQHEPLTANEIAQRVGVTAFEIKPALWRMQATGEPIRQHNDGVATTYWLDDGNDAPGGRMSRKIEIRMIAALFVFTTAIQAFVYAANPEAPNYAAFLYGTFHGGLWLWASRGLS